MTEFRVKARVVVSRAWPLESTRRITLTSVAHGRENSQKLRFWRLWHDDAEVRIEKIQ